MCESGQLVPISEAADLLATTETRILMMLKNGELKGHQEDGGWQVEKISLQLCNKPKASDVVRPGGCGGGCGSGQGKGGCGGH